MKTKKLTKELIGHFGVDSGQFIIVDPCYIKRFVNDNFEKRAEDNNKNFPFSYVGACNATLTTEGFGELQNGMAVASRTRHGDGQFPVYAYKNGNGEIVKVEISFEYEDEESDEDDEA